MRIPLCASTMCAVMLALPQRSDAQLQHVPAWQRYFDSAGVTGALIVYESDRRRYRTNDTLRVRMPYLPASTFKVFSTLAILAAGIVPGPDEVIPWDGQDRCIADWNRDLTLRQAYQVSAFWVYQRLVPSLGDDQVRDLLQRAEYGNREWRGGLQRFWLDGALRISLMQQIQFLEHLEKGQLPFSAATITAVQDIMAEERGNDFLLRGKTGWARQLSAGGDRFADCRPDTTGTGPAVDPEIGWYVGYAVRGAQTVYFALNIDIREPRDASARRAIVRRILAAEGLLDTAPR